MWADSGDAARPIDWTKKVLSLTIQVVKHTDDAWGFTVLPRRSVVERTFAWICKHRRCAPTAQKTPRVSPMRALRAKHYAGPHSQVPAYAPIGWDDGVDVVRELNMSAHGDRRRGRQSRKSQDCGGV
ncbi:hypothetical protein MLGJGCBP_08049 [Rhodococcus sp. T7]|nr:hypothetical protein MLGJGCBP_08960 [Rhodococcus sp. T7]KAF0958855.1 hypothetical protein MLGJGCBP_08049 [Rhodococcus sp. T7]